MAYRFAVSSNNLNWWLFRLRLDTTLGMGLETGRTTPLLETFPAQSSFSPSTLEMTTDVSKIAELLECPVCANTFNPPIFQCPSGHSVCSNCHKKLEECPFCMNAFTGARNEFAENFLELCQIPCKNQWEHGGCNVKLPGSQISGHYSTCEFEPLTCPSCARSVSYDQFIRHLQVECNRAWGPAKSTEAETEYVFDLWNPNFRLEKPIWIFRHNRHFFCFFKRFEKDCSLFICLLGTKKECEDFSCMISLSVENNEIDHPSRMYEGKVHPLRECAAQEVKGLTFSNEDLKKYFGREEGNTIGVTVKIDRAVHVHEASSSSSSS